MKRTLKSAILMIIVGILLFALTGCANVNYEIKLGKDGTGDVSYVIGYDKKFLNSMGVKVEDLGEDDTFEEMTKEATEDGYTVEKYEDENTYGFKASKHVNNIQDEFSFENQVNTDSGNDDRILFEKSFLKTKYSQNAKIDLSTVTGDDEDALASAMLAQMKVSYKIVLPFKVGENNASNVSEDGKTLEWTLTAGKVNEIKFEASEDYTMYAISGAAIILVLFVIVILLASKKGKKKDEKVVVEEKKAEEPIIAETTEEVKQAEKIEEQLEEVKEDNNLVQEEAKEVDKKEDTVEDNNQEEK